MAVFLWFFVLLLAQPSPGTVREGGWQGRCHPGANSPASLPACRSPPGKALALDRASAAASSPDLSECLCMPTLLAKVMDTGSDAGSAVQTRPDGVGE